MLFRSVSQSRYAWYSQAGLAVKTYLSDRFNNWLNTEWIDGTTGGINAITAVDVSDGKLTMDALILQKKIFNMLNRVTIQTVLTKHGEKRHTELGVQHYLNPLYSAAECRAKLHSTKSYRTQQQTKSHWEHLPDEEIGRAHV